MQLLLWVARCLVKSLILVEERRTDIEDKKQIFGTRTSLTLKNVLSCPLPIGSSMSWDEGPHFHPLLTEVQGWSWIC